MQKTSEDVCKAIKYGAYNCTYTAASGSGESANPASCTGGTTCKEVTSPADDTTCLEANFYRYCLYL